MAVSNNLKCVKVEINSISSQQISNYPSKTESVSFKGITKLLEREVHAIPYERAQRLIAMYQNPYLFAGTFPKDMLRILQKTSSSPKQLKQNIRVFNVRLSNLAENLQVTELNLLKGLNNIDLDDYSYRAILKSIKQDKDATIGFVKENIKLFLTKQDLEQTINSSDFEKTVKKIGLIPQDGRVQFSYVGKGTYKKCFKLNLLDKDGNPLIHPKAFVMAQNPRQGWDANLILRRKLGEHLQSQGFDKFKANMTERMLKDPNVAPEDIAKINEAIELFYNGKYKTVRLFDGADVMPEYYDVNGIFPEANAALKIKKDLGKDIDHSNFITPYFFDLKSKCGLLEFADSNLPPKKVTYNLNHHGLEWLDEKADNIGHGDKIIDFGCIIPTAKASYYAM